MAAPVINLATSILTLQQGTQFVFQPSVTSGVPTVWEATGLPPGAVIAAASGQIGGVPTTPGVGTISIRCKNSANEYSAYVYVAWGVTPSVVSNLPAVNLDVDLDTKVVWNPQISDITIPPLFAKTGDRVAVLVGFRKQGVLQDINALAINARLRGDNDSPPVLMNLSAMTKVGAYSQTRYLIILDFALAAVKQLVDTLTTLEDPPGAPGVHVFPQLEFESVCGIVFGSTVIPSPMTTRSFPVHLSREIA